MSCLMSTLSKKAGSMASIRLLVQSTMMFGRERIRSRAVRSWLVAYRMSEMAAHVRRMLTYSETIIAFSSIGHFITRSSDSFDFVHHDANKSA